jgi:predicted phosphodiesterase
MPESIINIIDLGDIQSPILIFGGAYSNLQASQAIKSVAEANDIPAESCICTGDTVAYCGQPSETVALIREWGVHCLLGNCEESFANNSDDCGCGFDNGSQCDLLSSQWFTFSNAQLSQSDRQWFSTLPHHIRFRINGFSAVVVHGSFSSINQFVFPSSDEAVFLNEFSLANTDLIIGGHSGIPFSKIIEQKIWHNSGAIGMPANDGTPHTWYSIISPQEDRVKIETKKLTYQHHDTFQIMQKNNLHNGYADCLLNGLWPSTDILPEKEKYDTGRQLSESTNITGERQA